MTALQTTTRPADMPQAKISGIAWAILAATGLGAFIAQGFGQIVNVAMPAMQADLEMSLTATAWIASSYFLAFAVTMVAGGRLADLVGEVRLIVIGYVVFALGCVLSAVAWDGFFLIIGRVIQGAGVGIAAPATLSIVVNAFPREYRGFAVGTWGLAHGAGIAISPLIGGGVTDTLGWRGLFLVTLPLTAVVIVATLLSTRRYKSPTTPGRYDVTGLAIGGLGVVSLVFGLTQSGDSGWTSPVVIGALAGGVALLVAFYFVERSSADPLIDFSLMRDRRYLGGFVAEFGFGFMYIPVSILLPGLFLVGVLHYSPADASLLFLPSTALTALSEPLAGRAIDVWGPRIPLTVGILIGAAALFWFSTIGPDMAYLELLGPLLVLGLAAGIVIPGGNAAGMSTIKKANAGMASGFLQMAFVIANSIGLAVVSTMTITFRSDHVDSATQGKPFGELAQTFASLEAEKGPDVAAKALTDVPRGVAGQVRHIANEALSSGLGTSFLILAFITIGVGIAVFLLLRQEGRPAGRSMPFPTTVGAGRD